MGYRKIEQYDEKTTSGLIDSYRNALSLLGEDPDREGLDVVLSSSTERHTRESSLKQGHQSRVPIANHE